MSKKPRYAATVRPGGFDIPNALVREALREKGFRTGEAVSLEIYKARNPKFNSLAHVFGTMLAEHLDAFAGMDPHPVLKRLQIEGNIACDEIALIFPGLGPTSYRVPRSLSFDQMDEAEFSGVYKAFCRYVAKTYWRNLTPEQVEQMAGLMADAA